MSSTIEKATSDELERYRERAKLAESVLKGKMEDLDLQYAKLEVIQDVVRKMKVKSDDRLKKWQQTCDVLRGERDEARQEVQSTTKELEKRKKSWASQRQRYEMQLQELVEQIENETSLAREYRRKYEEGKSQLQQIVEKRSKEKAMMKNDMEALQRDITKLKDQLTMEQELREKSLRRERDKITEMEAEMFSANENLNRALDEANERMNEEDEAIEIAEASVAAAERREAEIKAKYEALVSKFENERSKRESITAPEVDKLQKEVEELNEQIQSLKMAHGAELRAERRMAEARIGEVVEKYQRQMQRIRSAALSGSLGQSDQSQDEGGGVWKRIRRPFRRQRP